MRPCVATAAASLRRVGCAALLVAVIGGCGAHQRSPAGVRVIAVGREYAELLSPSRGPVRGTMLLFHKGGWAAEGAAAVRALRPMAERFRGSGWRALTSTYRQGQAGLADVLAAFDYAARRYGAAPICAYGESSGGYWALILAGKRPRLRCVIAAAAPTDLVAWPSQVRDRPTRAYVIRTLSTVFGRSRAALASASPVRAWRSGMRVRLFLFYADDDPLVPPAQGTAMQRRVRGSALFRLPPGGSPWVHSRPGRGHELDGVDAPALARDYRVIENVLRRLPTVRH